MTFDRCTATTVGGPVTDDQRAWWCEMPRGHAGWHHATRQQPGQPSAECDWEGQPPADSEGHWAEHTASADCPCQPTEHLRQTSGRWCVIRQHRAPTEIIGDEQAAFRLMREYKMPDGMFPQ